MNEAIQKLAVILVAPVFVLLLSGADWQGHDADKYKTVKMGIQRPGEHWEYHDIIVPDSCPLDAFDLPFYSYSYPYGPHTICKSDGNYWASVKFVYPDRDYGRHAMRTEDIAAEIVCSELAPFRVKLLVLYDSGEPQSWWIYTTQGIPCEVSMEDARDYIDILCGKGDGV